MKKFLLIIVFLTLQGCSEKGYNFAKYAVNTGFNIAEDAGAFKEREIIIKKKYSGDTLFYYDGINRYFITKTDSTYKVVFTPSRKNLEDTTLYFLKKKKNIDKQIQE